MKLLFSTFLLFFSIQLLAQSTPATKDDIRIIQNDIKNLNEKFDLVLHQMDKRFEQVDKRLEMIQNQMDKRFDDMNSRFEMINLILGVIITAIGFLYIRLWSVSNKLTAAISDLKNSIAKQNQIAESKETKPLDENQLIYILSNSNQETKLKIRKLLQIS